MTGYLHPDYAKSLSEFGVPRELPECGAWVLERQIPGTSERDAMGCYPIFQCRDWSSLKKDIENLRNDLVSIALVADPFGDYDISYLQECFDIVKPFKEHFIADLSQPLASFVAEKHRYWARRALREIKVELCEDPLKHLDEWVKLYGGLVERERLTGIKAFSKKSFADQFRVPGFKMFRAVYQGITVGLQTYYVHGDIAYGHLMSMSEIGYKTRASYAMTWASFEHLSKEKIRWVDMGGVPGVCDGASEGLAAFKRGWASGTRMAYFCGAILAPIKYRQIVDAKGIAHTDYFPAYRLGEFG
ncbi:MAG: peptidoglycan bridge formation glycyltransferase FemA/FemB family protein [Armatimonadota bacterium]|nr:peptidoglycan bridge formation glycyltransferase FemA/FemB family protein [Armatimonadota bacterium]